jgi:VCBS repeat protein
MGSIEPGNGNGTFRPGTSRLLDASYQAIAAVGDLNRDGRTDAVVAKNGVGLEIWFGNGAGAFASSVVVPVRGGIAAVQVADLNHDAYLDIVARTVDELGIVLNGPTGFLEASYRTLSHTTGSSAGNGLALADLNLDGNIDIVIDDGALLPGLGDGRFGTAALFDFGLDSSGVRVADFDRDGLPDMLVGESHGAVRLLVNERNSVNHPPIADAGADRTIAYQDQFNDGNGFFIGGPGGSDPDSHALRFEWRDSIGAIISTDRATGILAKSPGAYTFQLTVFDDRGGSGTDSVGRRDSLDERTMK